MDSSSATASPPAKIPITSRVGLPVDTTSAMQKQKSRTVSNRSSDCSFASSGRGCLTGIAPKEAPVVILLKIGEFCKFSQRELNLGFAFSDQIFDRKEANVPEQDSRSVHIAQGFNWQLSCD